MAKYRVEGTYWCSGLLHDLMNRKMPFTLTATYAGSSAIIIEVSGSLNKVGRIIEEYGGKFIREGSQEGGNHGTAT